MQFYDGSPKVKQIDSTCENYWLSMKKHRP